MKNYGSKSEISELKKNNKIAWTRVTKQRKYIKALEEKLEEKDKKNKVNVAALYSVLIGSIYTYYMFTNLYQCIPI